LHAIDKILGATTPASPVIERKPAEMGEVRGVLRRSPAIVRVEVKPPPHKQRATCGIEGSSVNPDPIQINPDPIQINPDPIQIKGKSRIVKGNQGDSPASSPAERGVSNSTS
jgi:hypothetical protein